MSSFNLLQASHGLGDSDVNDLGEPILDIHPTADAPRAFEPILIEDWDGNEAPEITLH